MINKISWQVDLIILLTIFFNGMFLFIKWFRNRYSVKISPEYRNAIVKARKFYVIPNVQSINPSFSTTLERDYAARENAIKAMNVFVEHKTDSKFMLILGESGMGKTSLLLNFYHLMLKQHSKKYTTYFIPLNQPDSNEQIDSIINKEKSIILLDGIDENVDANKTRLSRFQEIVHKCRTFHKIILTSRTNFFRTEDEEIVLSNILKIYPDSLKDSPVHVFFKLYISPFSKDQIKAYISKRYPWWQLNRRRKALDISYNKMNDLSARPLLL